MEQEQLSPHDETILFRLVEFERSLPREDQSHRFELEVTVTDRPGEPPEASFRAATAFETLTLRTDASCFTQLRDAGYITGGEVDRVENGIGAMGGISYIFSRYYLLTVTLTDSAFKYHDEKHDFPTALADERRELVYSRISTYYPEVVAHLKKAYDAIWVDQPDGNWSGVAHDCQNALRSFADKVYKPEYASKLQEEEPSRADFEKKLEQTIRANTGGEELRGLLVKLNAYANARRHDKGMSRDEAKRCVLFTYLLVAEICELLGLSEAT